MHFICGFIASSAFLLLPPIWSSIASFLYPSPAFSGRGGGVFRVFLFSASSVCFNVPFVVVLLHPLWYYWFHCFSFNCAFCPLSSFCLSSASIVYPSTANYVFKIFLFCFLNFIKTVIPFTTSAFAFKSTLKNVNTFTMFISNLLMSIIAHAENSLW